jgi:hypothetical protein
MTIVNGTLSAPGGGEGRGEAADDPAATAIVSRETMVRNTDLAAQALATARFSALTPPSAGPAADAGRYS